MGAEMVIDVERGKDAADAFETLRQEYLDEFLAYSIAGKKQIKMFKLPKGKDPEEYADELLGKDGDLQDAWKGPVGCIKIRNREFLFFAWVKT